MKGLRTQESKKFINFFSLVQDTALENNCVFFLDSGDGNEFKTETMEGENLQGWLIPFTKAEEFEKIWKNKNESDEWVEFFCWAEWKIEDGNVKVIFINE